MLTMLVPLAVFGLFASLALLVFGKLFSSAPADATEQEPKRSTNGWFVAIGLVLLVFYLLGSVQPSTEQERLDRDAQRLIRQHSQQVDRDMHEMKVRIRAEQMLRGR